MLTPETLDALRHYCKIDTAGADEEVLLGELYRSAVEYIGLPEPQGWEAWAASWGLCVKALVLDAYDRRSATVTGSPVQDNPAFRRRLGRLKAMALVPGSDTV